MIEPGMKCDAMRPYRLLDRNVCKRAIMTLTGASHRIAQFRIAMVNGVRAVPIDLRFARSAVRFPVLRGAGQDCNTFLEQLYWMVETMPDVKDVVVKDVELPS